MLNEEGTEATAATGLIVQYLSLQLRPKPQFFAEHPFIFMLVKENDILFCGIFQG
uniref:Serpin domain-containing protein n=1 Tax=Meloidogyne incognita TaxID=6306 RepID=A0A914MRJ1_MELIC